MPKLLNKQLSGPTKQLSGEPDSRPDQQAPSHVPVSTVKAAEQVA
uniref:Uncharacterized protein n=1 Tax=Lupinus angustifolius TaxID=3871 RepID=L0P2E6_LUPAN|nr:hypothetical protein [Lupinus angustifolius]